MREIIFRGWCPKNKWVYGALIIWPDGDYYILHQTEEDRYFEMTKTPVDPATVGQYTGLKDKNGEKIWEGDIIQYKSYAAGKRWWRTTEEIPEIEREVQQQRDEYVTKRGVCEYSDGNFSVDGIFLFYVKVGERIRTYTCTSRDVEERQWDFEVIGNIHDNPELLKSYE